MQPFPVILSAQPETFLKTNSYHIYLPFYPDTVLFAYFAVTKTSPSQNVVMLAVWSIRTECLSAQW